MDKKIQFDYSNTLDFLKESEIFSFQPEVSRCHQQLHEQRGLGKEFLGWMDVNRGVSAMELEEMKGCANEISANSQVFVVIGVGGSYLGARAVIEMLGHSFYNEISALQRGRPEIYFAGQNLSGTYLRDLFDVIGDRDVTVNVISKSGTTMEPMLTFRIFRDYLEKRYGKEEAGKRIIVTTDSKQGALRKLADAEGFRSFRVPGHIGGRYSVLTPVGLLPIAVAGIDVDALLEGARKAQEDLIVDSIEGNPAYQYAVIRNLLYQMDKTIELFVTHEPKLHYFTEWLKQLFGESEGKDRKGIFPASLIYTTDLHALGQYIQDGKRQFLETVLNVETFDSELLINESQEDFEGFNYLAGQSFESVSQKAVLGCVKAHVQGDVPNLIVTIPKLEEFYVGYLIYFFLKSCAMSGYLLGVNPFDQPGVEVYKRNVKRMLR